jgi:Concanavalin A-like lectin/glucanases superfamily
MGQTPVHQLPYPELSDPADVPQDIKELAQAIDALIPTVPVIPPGGGGFVNIPVLEVGMPGQNRAGRQLAPADFTNLGLAAPLGLWNLSNLTDASGNNRTLVNKGSVPFGAGINAQAASCAVFAGSTGQALYFDDQGTNDPLRIRTGSWGAWFRTAKRGTAQYVMAKSNAAANVFAYGLGIQAASNGLAVVVSVDGVTPFSFLGSSDVCDDRWHFAVATHDGTNPRLYVDGALEAKGTLAGTLGPAAAPLDIGGFGADNTTAASQPFYGRVDEAFVTGDVLTDDQVRLLYSAKLAHALGAIPGDVRIAVHRKRRGAPLSTTDFPAAPVRLHNFTAGALTDQGSGNIPLAPVGGGSIVPVAGADGVTAGAQSFSGAHTGLGATDAGLPAALAARSYGLWFKTTGGGVGLIGWGGLASGNASTGMRIGSTGALVSESAIASGAIDTIVGPTVNDGLWHLAIVTEDNTAGDGVKRKLYLDGRLVGGSTVLNTLTLAGANRFRVGSYSDGTFPLTGQADAPFIYAGALTVEQVQALYAKSSQDLAASTKDPGDHIERVDGNSILAVFDSVDGQNTIDLGVAA